MNKDQQQTEDLVNSYIDSLEKQLKNLNALNGANTGFIKIQEVFTTSINDCIDQAKARVQEVKTGAVWDNLVIAFFGETNAGKSTIIETFRILFEEEGRSRSLRNNPEGVDGLIVGIGKSDCTRVYKEYKMNISGMPFTLIDVPGIEGNESLYESEIKQALNKAHYVFYVQGQNKKPDAGTAGKIKKYLREWVKVYSIYNVRGVASHYDEVEERESLLTDSEVKIENQIKQTFSEVLGHTYMGNISLQAYLALCSKAKFAPSRADLLREQKKIISYFVGEDNLYSFSQFDSLVNLVEQKAKNFSKEIVEANKAKHKALLSTIYNELKTVSEDQEKHIVSLENSIKSFQKNVKQDFSSTKNNISNISSCKYDQIFSQITDDAMYAICNDVGDKVTYCQIRADQITTDVAKSLQIKISSEIQKLNSNILKRKKNIDQELKVACFCGSKTEISLNPDFKKAIDKLDFSLVDFGHIVGTAISGILGYFALANFWNPLGWFAALLTVGSLIFGGRDKVAQAKQEMRNKINEAKQENLSAFNSQISKIKQDLDKTRNSIIRSVNKDIVNLERLRKNVQDIIQIIKIEYSKLNISEYGKL